MKILKGKGVFGGISFGNIAFYNNKTSRKIIRRFTDNHNRELEKFEKAKILANAELQILYNEASKNIGEDEAAIFLIQKTILSDEVLNKSITKHIKDENYTAEFAVSSSFDEYINMFSNLKDEYFRERVADIKDISNRIVGILTGKRDKKFKVFKPMVIAAEDLSPSETVTLDKNKVLAFVTAKGSTTSHTAILARTMNIPAIVGLDNQLLKEYDGCFVAVDGFEGKLYIEPSDEVIGILNKKQSEYNKYQSLLRTLVGKESITKNGKKVDILSNISTSDEVDVAIENDSKGIGLFRSEFIFLSNNFEPSEEQQFETYKTVAEKMNGKKVVIRTLDLGADKTTDYINYIKEDNPAMGCRAIRYCLKNIDLFKRQLRAICRASAYGNISIMFPMITSVDEVKMSRDLLEEVKNELENENIDFNKNIKVGIMIETPAAAIICDKLCEYSDFFSIGTNDLTQYLLAMDRQNQGLEMFYNPYHESVFRLVKYVTDTAHNHNIKVCICGELGADINAIKNLIEIGIDSLSVAPYRVLQIKDEIIKMDLSN